MNFGPLLKNARLQAGLSQEKLAEMLKLPLKVVSELENNKRKLNLLTATKWFECTIYTESER